MTEIATISLTSLENVIELRNKVLSLLLFLKFNPMESIRIVTKISNVVHALCLKQKVISVKFSIDKKDILQISLDILNIPLRILKEYCSNLNADFSPINDNNGGRVYLNFPIQSKQYKNDKNYIQTLKEYIIIKSKAELMTEIKRKNKELNNLIEDLKKSATLIQSEKMRALGVLTAGVAHELNNPMMGILNFIQYCLKKIQKGDKCHQALLDAEIEIKRCINIVANLLTFSHLEQEDKAPFKPVNIKILIERVTKILSYRIRNEDITVKLQIPETIPSILGHENRLQQVILNMVTNAMDAMKSQNEKILSISINTDSENIRIQIADTGEGMDEETKQRLFEPFFTTKQVGSGTGLGLSVCESIVALHHGSIVLHSEKQKGTEFIITLPLHMEANHE